VDDGTLLRAGLVIGAYLVGSIPFGVIAARLSGGPDPRTIGSGRTGGTNALRALGRGWALFVVLGDVAKGALPVLVARIVTGDPVVEVLCGSAALLGAVRSIYLRFSGGRGVGTGVGTMLVIQPLAVVLAVPVFVGVIALTGFVSLGSLLGSAAMIPWTAVLGWAFADPAAPVHLAYACVGVAIIWFAHADNIERLLHGTERRLDVGLLLGRRSGPS
jgi:glycerol-3-phosphate acyltransferase PlsY